MSVGGDGEAEEMVRRGDVKAHTMWWARRWGWCTDACSTGRSVQV